MFVKLYKIITRDATRKFTNILFDLINFQNLSAVICYNLIFNLHFAII